MSGQRTTDPAASTPRSAIAMTGAQSLVRSLESAGVEVVFGIPGGAILPLYDPLMAKLCVWGRDRPEALARARAAVAAFEIVGPKQNLPFFAELLDLPEFVAGDYDTTTVHRMRATGATP